MSADRLIAIFGPTAIGKTDIAIALAERLRADGRTGVAVSADALQIYRGLGVLTGAADVGQQRLLEHRLLSFVDVSESFSAGRYAELAHREIDALLAAGQVPIVVGGTGLYLRAALADLSLAPPPPPELRARWRAELQAQGPRALHELLTERAPEHAATIAPTDAQRIVRALELYELGALPPPRGADSELWTEAMRRPTLLVGLTMGRNELRARIDERVDAMLAAGVEAEVRAAVAAGAGESARKALGFRELLAGDTEAMKRRTHAYARRQLTWMRKLAGVWTVDISGRDAASVATEIHDRWAG
jgi:tRNA dimethylallyltransferase